MVVKKRAISEKDKLKRKTKILNTAGRLFFQKGGQLPTVSQIAGNAGLSKGTVYLYFNTKEEIFMELYLLKLTEWAEFCITGFKEKSTRLSPEEMSQLLTGYIIKNPDVAMMGSIAKSVLEENINNAVLIKAKISSALLLEAAGELFAENFPEITKERGAEITLWIISLITGLWQLATHPPHISEMIKKEKLAVLEPDFAESVTNAVTALIRGSI